MLSHVERKRRMVVAMNIASRSSRETCCFTESSRKAVTQLPKTVTLVNIESFAESKLGPQLSEK